MTTEQKNPADAVIKRVIKDLGSQSQVEQLEQKNHIEVGQRLTNVFGKKPAPEKAQEEAPAVSENAKTLRAQLLAALGS